MRFYRYIEKNVFLKLTFSKEYFYKILMNCILEQLKYSNEKPLPKAWCISVEITNKIINQNEEYPKLETDFNILKEEHQRLKMLSNKATVEKHIQENQQKINKLEQIVASHKNQLNDIMNEKKTIFDKIKENKQQNFNSQKKNDLLSSEIDEITKQIENIDQTILSLNSRIGEQNNVIESLNYIIQAEQKMLKIIDQAKNKCKKVHFSQDDEESSSSRSSISRWKYGSSVSSTPNFKVADQRKRSKSFSASSHSISPKLETNSKPLSEILEKTTIVHKGCITTIAFSNNGKYYACGSEDNVVCIYSFAKSLPIEYYQMDKSVISLNFNSTDSLLLVACFNTVQIFEYTPSGFHPRPDKIIIEKILHTEFISNDRFVVCSENHALRLYKVSKTGPKFKKSLVPKITTAASWICPAFGSNEFAAGYQTGTIRIWDPHSGHTIYENGVHQNPVLQIIFHGSSFVSLSQDGLVGFVNSLSRIVEKKIYLKGCPIHEKTQMAIYGKSILIGGDDGLIYEYSIHDGKFISKWPSFHSTPITAISANKYWVVSGDREGKVKVWTDFPHKSKK